MTGVDERVSARPLTLSASCGAGWDPTHAEALVRTVLECRPSRLAHSLQAGSRAQFVLAAVPAADVELLVSAALLHDIGYAPTAAVIGFHPLDGANLLLGLGAPRRLAALVAHHSEAGLLAAAQGLARTLSSFANERSAVTDALVYADMTAGPDGEPIGVADRLEDIEARHADDEPALMAARLARVPRLLAAVDRVQTRTGAAYTGRA